MGMNREWHSTHPMPPRLGFEDRLAWHAEHVQVCGCRQPPADIAAELERRTFTEPLDRLQAAS